MPQAIHFGMKNGDHLFLVDGSGFIFRAFHAIPPLNRKSDGLPVNAVSGFCNMLWKLLRDARNTDVGVTPTHFAVIFDYSSKTFRNDLYHLYKANRSAPPEDLVPQFGLIREATRAFNLPCIETEGFEADDIIATYARLAEATGADVTIISSDKDLMQLVTPNVHMYDAMKDKQIGIPDVVEKWGVAPEKMIDLQALTGDSTDNVPGIPGSVRRPQPSFWKNSAISKRCCRGPARSSSRNAAKVSLPMPISHGCRASWSNCAPTYRSTYPSRI